MKYNVRVRLVVLTLNGKIPDIVSGRMFKYFLQLSSPSCLVNFNEGNLSFDGSSKILEKFPTLHVEIPRFRVSSAAQPIITISEKTKFFRF